MKLILNLLDSNESLPLLRHFLNQMNDRRYDGTYLCISAADLLIPLSSKMSSPVMAVAMRNRGRDNKNVNARQGGNLALADFHETPPLESNMLNRVGRNNHEKVTEKMRSRRESCRAEKALRIDDLPARSLVGRSQLIILPSSYFIFFFFSV